MCAARLNDGPLVCVRGEHDGNGHVYESTSATDDRHGEGGHG